MTLKAAVFAVMEEGVNRASGGGADEYSHRTLMYQVRPLVQQFPIKGSRDLTQEYFRKLTDQYQRDYGPLKGL